MENPDIHEAILAIMEALRHQGKSPGTLKGYESGFNAFERFLLDNKIEQIDVSICMEYVYQKTGCRYERFECVTSNKRVDYYMRPLLLLLHYMEDGQIHQEARKTKPPIICPESFALEYEAFCEELEYRGYSKSTTESNARKSMSLIMHLASEGVTSSADITIQHIEDYLKTLGNKAVKTVGEFLYVFRNYFSFLYERGYIINDLAPLLPKVRTPRNATVPYVWSKEDLQKLLGAVDRADPKGKRDYAVLLLAIRLGLRIGDIRGLKKSSIDWNRKTINLIMSKTGQHIELPLLKDVGWAIIDYLQNGRPATNSECIIVRHRAPFNAIGGIGTFTKELYRYTIKADLSIPGNQRHGMHSLRSTLAGNLLEIKSPLPIISEALGHQSVNTTSIYLKIDIEGLRKCAIDPEGVYCVENTL
ncbi:MAG: tyrosine-type recombinase/integrase [Oscillospiraceae bacterium]|nr:tyrosine-type recombinase/integrase [Oscillospiraceae bacterium]